MSSVASLSIADLESYSKFAQLYSVIYCSSIRDSTIKIKQAKRVIRKRGDINYKIPLTSVLWQEASLKGGTLLHIACNSCSIEIVEDLLNLNADFGIKNKDGDTALHVAFKMSSYFPSNKFPKYEADMIVDLILSAHVYFANSSNPSNKFGLSHFHIACTANNTEAVEFFLKNGVDVNQATDKNAEIYLGFTPLHFAVKFYSTETIKILMNHGAEKSIKSAGGMTPLLYLINCRIQLLITPTWVSQVNATKVSLEDELNESEKVIFMLLGNKFLDKVDIVDASGLSSLHVACTLQDIRIVEKLLYEVEDINHFVDADSPLWPGNTAMHFAAHCDINIMKILHENGASIDIKNTDGLTPLDICIESGRIDNVYSAVLLEPEWANIFFSDNETTLANFLCVLQDTTLLDKVIHNCVDKNTDTNQLKNFLDGVDNINMTLPMNSPLWPRCTPLHLAVIVSKKYDDLAEHYIPSEVESMLNRIEMLLKIGADVTLEAASGKTPLDYAFQEEKTKISQLLRNYKYFVDKNLISTMLNDFNNIYKGETSVQNIKPSWTPPVHVDEGEKITLHAACSKGDKDTVKRLLELEANVNATMDDGQTPLHVVINGNHGNSIEIIQLLLHRGADLLIKDNKGNTPLSLMIQGFSTNYANDCKDMIISILKLNKKMQKRIKKETGITMLHIACFLLDVEEVKNQLEHGVYVNTRVQKSSKLWPGYTPLHVLMSKSFMESVLRDANIITKLLLENAANVTLVNANKNTPVHMAYRCGDRYDHTRLLLQHQRDFRINPVNHQGISHFHLAVMLNDFELVKKFLEQGVDVNQPPDYFAQSYEGCTPLHMALNNLSRNNDLRIVDLLLTRGADVNLEDARGKSALRKTLDVGLSRLDLIEKLLSLGANIHSEDIDGVTAFESILQSGRASVEDVQIFLKHGCCANFNNPADGEGYLGIILKEKDKIRRDFLFEEMMSAPDVGTVNEFGRTLIHNAVAVKDPKISSNEYMDLFKTFERLGFDVDDQDDEGKTPLHLAARYVNHEAISALLEMGADLNIVDSSDKTPLFYAIQACDKCPNNTDEEHHHKDTIEPLVLQIQKLEVAGLYVSQSNLDNSTKSSELVHIKNDLNEREFLGQLDDAKDFSFQPLPLTVGDFLSDYKAVMKYPFMSELARDAIDEIFLSIDTYEFDEISSLLKLQYRKAVTRLQATSCLNILVNFPLPTMCVEIILSFLSNEDSRSIVVAVNLAK